MTRTWETGLGSGSGAVSYTHLDVYKRQEYGRPRAAVGFEYDDIIFETRGDADLVLDQLESAIAKYEVASVADLYDLAGVTCRNYTANRYGWSDIQSAKVVRTSEGYVIRLPRAVQIN